MSELLYNDFWWVQAVLATTFFGVVFAIWGGITENPKRVRWGLFAFLVTALLGIPIYFNGEAILEAMQRGGYAKEAITTFKADYYTTLIVTFFLGITSLMSLVMQRSLKRVPRLFLYPVTFYALLVILYLGWRTTTQLS